MSLRAVKAVIVAGEPTHVEYVVASQCDEPLHVMEGGDYRNKLGRNDSFRFTIAERDGTPVEVRRVGPGFGGFIGGEPTSRGKPFVKPLLLPLWARLDKPGVYRITVEKELDIRGKDWRAEARGPKQPARASTTIEVLPATRESLGAVIEALAAQAAAGTRDECVAAMAQLAQVDDARVTHHLTDMEDDEESRRLAAVRVLAGFGSDASLAALEARLGAPKPATRLEVVRAIAQNENPRAAQLLWSLRTDKLESVRIEVARGVHRKDPAGAKAKLEELSRDPSPAVRAEVARLARQAPASP